MFLTFLWFSKFATDKFSSRGISENKGLTSFLKDGRSDVFLEIMSLLPPLESPVRLN